MIYVIIEYKKILLSDDFLVYLNVKQDFRKRLRNYERNI